MNTKRMWIYRKSGESLRALPPPLAKLFQRSVGRAARPWYKVVGGTTGPTRRSAATSLLPALITGDQRDAQLFNVVVAFS